VAGKIIVIAGQVLPGAIILFPLVYILGDVITEIYGFKQASLVIWTGFAINLLMAAVFSLILFLPSPDFFLDSEAFETVLGMAPRVVAASLCAYLTGEFVNSIVLSKIKKMTQGRWLWLRIITSSLLGEGLDSVIFISLAFGGQVAGAVLIQMTFSQYFIKIGYEILVTPITYAVINRLKQVEKVDVYDHEVAYNPFKVLGR
jgi:uncharacterized integral membrane protein (TIGR00697 family)